MTINGPGVGERDICKECGVEICYEKTAYGCWWRHYAEYAKETHQAVPTNWVQVDKTCKLNCKSKGPPGPLWCTECGHDPRCCTCEVEYAPASASGPSAD